MAKNEVEKVTASAQLPAGLDYEDADSGAGMENIDAEELRIPFIRVLQSNSPQVDASKGGIVLEGAKPGMFIHMGTEELYPGDGSVEFITAHRSREYVEWTPVDAGGGLVGRLDWEDPEVATLKAQQGRFGKLETGKGTEIVQTFYLYGLLIPQDGVPRRVVLSFTSTQIKKYQAVLERVNSMQFVVDGKARKPPLYAWRWKLYTGPEKNKKGSWFGIFLRPAGEDNLHSLLPRNDPLFFAAKDFHELIASGQASANVEQLKREAEDEVDSAPPFDPNTPIDD